MVLLEWPKQAERRLYEYRKQVIGGVIETLLVTDIVWDPYCNYYSHVIYILVMLDTERDAIGYWVVLG